MKMILNLVLITIVGLLLYFLWNYMHIKPLIKEGSSRAQSGVINGDERIAITRYLQKSRAVGKVQSTSVKSIKIEEVAVKKEQNQTHKPLKISILSILKKGKKSLQEPEKNQTKALTVSEEFNTTKPLKKNTIKNRIEGNKSSQIPVSSKKSNENYTIYGELNISKQKSKKKRSSPSLAQKSLWLKAKKEPLKVALKRVGAKVGDPLFIRIFKKSNELEVWIKPKKFQRYKLLKIYKICKYSGGLGPKLMQGDKKSPEGFYRVNYSALNPKSNYHLAFNLGFPNRYDQYHGYTGSYLMVHGKCASVGCYAMGDRNIDDIYMLVEKALLNGQMSVDVHIFPFRMTKSNLARFRKSKWYKFWLNLKEGYDAFEQSHQVPQIDVVNGRYKVLNKREIFRGTL